MPECAFVRMYGVVWYHRVQRSGNLLQKVRGYIRKDYIRRPLLFVVAPGTPGRVFLRTHAWTM